MFYPMLAGGAMSAGYASIEAASAQNTARDAKRNAELLAQDVHRLLLIAEALWMMLKQQNGYADDVLVNMIEEIDSRKTLENGLAAKNPPQICPDCGRNNSPGRLHCIYCGKPLKGNPFER